MTFGEFHTIVADVKLSKGWFYCEVGVLKNTGVAQFGVCTDGFEAAADCNGNGVGDDSFSFAVDGTRQLKWPGGAYGSKWAVGQVIGFVIDMSKEGCARMSVSVDGSFAAPNGLAFDAISAAWLSPAFSAAFGKYQINFGASPFKHYPPHAFYVSVHQACCTSKGIAPASGFGYIMPWGKASWYNGRRCKFPYVKSPIVLSCIHQVTGRRVPISLVANGVLLTPAALREQFECPHQLLTAGAFFFKQRQPLGCKRRRQQPPFPFGFISAQKNSCVPVRPMLIFVSRACVLLASAPVNMHVIYRTTWRWAERVMDRVMRGRMSSLPHPKILKAAAAARLQECDIKRYTYINIEDYVDHLCHSAEEGDGGLVLCHLIANADYVNTPSKELNVGTALHCAAVGGHLEICRLLLQCKADPQAQTSDCLRAPIHAAASRYHTLSGSSIAIVELLISKGADVNVQDK